VIILAPTDILARDSGETTAQEFIVPCGEFLVSVLDKFLYTVIKRKTILLSSR
jgi:hypothetical protein